MNISEEMEKLGFVTITTPCCSNCKHAGWSQWHQYYYCQCKQIPGPVRAELPISDTTVCKHHQPNDTVEIHPFK